MSPLSLSKCFQIHKGSVFDVREHWSLPCSCLNRFGMLFDLPSSYTRNNNLVLNCRSRRVNEVQTLPGYCPLNLQTRDPTLFGQASCLYSPIRCQVKSEDSERTLSGESIILKEENLEQELQTAIEEENYAQAAEIRDRLRHLQEDGEASVLAANARFYNSFRRGDLAAMQALWSKGDNVCVVHPGVSGITGYDLVMGSWELVWADYEFPLEIEIRDVQVHVRGDFGYATCIEMVRTKGRNWGRQFATNVFERIDGQWFICVHHASLIDL